MYDDFKTANYPFSLVSPEMAARHLSRAFTGDVIDGLETTPGTGLQVVLSAGNAFVRYGAAKVASARMVSLVDDFTLTVTTPDSSNPRIDSVVLYIDESVELPTVDSENPATSANLDGPGVAKAILVAGTPNSSPVSPNDAAIQAAIGNSSYPYTVLADVQVDNGVSVIAENKITNRRDMTMPVIRDGSITPVMRTGGFAIGQISAATMNSTGNKSVTGLGFKPKLVKFKVTPTASGSASNWGEGAMTATSQYYYATGSGGSSFARNTSQTSCIGYVIGSTSTPALLAQRVSLDADGFTINVTTAASVDVEYEAFG